MTGFQKVVNLYQAPAVVGDFCDNNPRATVNAGEAALVAGPNGVTVGNFAWIAADNRTVNNYGSAVAGAPRGFVHREQQALITQYLGESSLLVPTGFMVTLTSAGGVWVRNNSATATTINEQVYARYSDGAPFFGSAPAGATATGSLGSTNTASIGSTSTGTATGTALTLSSVTGFVGIGDTISGTGVPAGTTIVSQTSGTANGAGVYVTSQATTAAAATITSYGTTLDVTATTGLISVGDTVSGGGAFPVGATIVAQVSGTAGGAGIYTLSAPATAYVASATGVTTYGVTINVSAVGSGLLYVGDPITGTNIPAGAVIASQVSGATGGVGVYTISIAGTQYVASEALTITGGVAVTGWLAKSVANPGELVKISTWP